MSRVYHVLPAADRDLDDQAAYLLAEASLDTALRFYDAASVTFGKIAGMPGIGEQWPSANPRLDGLRVWRIEGFRKSPDLLPCWRQFGPDLRLIGRERGQNVAPSADRKEWQGRACPPGLNADLDSLEVGHKPLLIAELA